MELHDEAGELVATTEFTMACPCGGTRQFSGGYEMPHDCSSGGSPTTGGTDDRDK